MLSGALSFHQAKGEKSTEAKPPKVIVRQATSRAGRVPIHQPLPQIATPFGLQLVHLCSSRGPIVPRLRHQRKVTQPRHGLHARRPASCGARSGAAAIRLRASCFISGRGRAPARESAGRRHQRDGSAAPAGGTLRVAARTSPRCRRAGTHELGARRSEASADAADPRVGANSRLTPSRGGRLPAGARRPVDLRGTGCNAPSIPASRADHASSE
jgi:hypothetical protein